MGGWKNIGSGIKSHERFCVMKIIGGEQAIEFEHIVDLGHAMIEKGQSRLLYSLGRSALAAILENEISHGNNSILLPDYLCESITNTVISLGMEYSFYHIKSDLQPDLDSINRQINEKQIILLRYGFYEDTCYTLEEVGMRFGITRERVRQIEAKALKKMRLPALKLRLDDYI